MKLAEDLLHKGLSKLARAKLVEVRSDDHQASLRPIPDDPNPSVQQDIHSFAMRYETADEDDEFGQRIQSELDAQRCLVRRGIQRAEAFHIFQLTL